MAFDAPICHSKYTTVFYVPITFPIPGFGYGVGNSLCAPASRTLECDPCLSTEKAIEDMSNRVFNLVSEAMSLVASRNAKLDYIGASKIEWKAAKATLLLSAIECQQRSCEIVRRLKEHLATCNELLPAA
jgi:hypothetical protein